MMKTKKTVVKVYGILLGLIVFYGYISSCSGKSSGELETDSNYIDSLYSVYPQWGIADLDSCVNSMELSSQARTLMDMSMAYAIVYDMVRKVEDAVILDYNNELASGVWEKYVKKLVVDGQTREVISNYCQAMEPNMENLKKIAVVDSIRDLLYEYTLKKWPLSEFVAMDETEYYEYIHGDFLFPLELPRNLKDVSADEAENMFEQIESFMRQNGHHADKIGKSVMEYARVSFVTTLNRDRAMSLLREVVLDDKYSVYDYYCFRMWRVFLQSELGISRMSDIPNEIYNAGRWTCLMNAYKQIMENPENKFAWNAVFLLSTERELNRRGTYGNNYLEEVHNLGIGL